MTAGATDALEQAIALYRAPGRLPLLRERQLPGAVLVLLRIAGSDQAAIAGAVTATGETAETLIEAAVLYIQQVLFMDSADAYWLLGVRSDATDAQIKEHYRWLMRWLHPDRHSERWEVVYSDRVNRAWQELRSSARRDAYNPSSSHAHLPTPALDPRAQQMRSKPRPDISRPLLSAHTARRLPQIVLGGLALGALVVLGLLYSLREEDPGKPSPQQEPVLSTTSAAQKPAPTAPVARLLGQAVIPTQPAVPTGQKTQSGHVLAALPPLPLPELMAYDDHDKRHLPPPDRPAASFKTETPSEQIVDPTDRMRRRHAGDEKKPVDATAEHQTKATAVGSSEAIHEQSPKPLAHPAASSPQDAARILSQSFAQAYVAGDLGAMMRLFSVNAVDNQGDVAAIAEDYGRLFRGTQRRELRLDRLAWTTGENRIIGSGPFEAIIRRHGDVFTRHVDGWITIEAGLVDGDWRIQRIIHRDTP